MGLQYQAEYRIGRRGGRVCRTYSGCRAFVAIFLDLIFGLVFDVIGAVFALVMRSFVVAAQLATEVLKFTWRLLVFVMETIVHLLALPLKIMQRMTDSPEWRQWPDSVAIPRDRRAKPDWGLGREV
jgi:hypothetical protein